MRLRVFRAARMAEAMAACRAELGEEAVILSSRRVGGQIEITAALEAEEPLLIPPAPAEPPPAAPTALAWHNLPGPLADRLGAGPLEATLAATIPFRHLPDGRARPVLLAGPPGAGKTLSAAKLAARAVLAGLAPLVVTTDGQRAGATEQLAAFTRLLGLTLAVAGSPGTLAKALARRAPGQPVIVDTAGCDPFDPAAAAALLAFARAAEAEIVCVLPGALDPLEAGDLARAFAAMGARHLLPTRLDQARRLGGVLAAAAAGPLALAEAGTGPGAADGLTALSPAWLADRLRHGVRLPPKDQAA
jgi:flagellar biosynthesis protein FlhF